MTIGRCLEVVAPYYNLGLVIIVIILFLVLFTKSGKKVYLPPWIILFISICIYIVEQVMNVMFNAGLIVFPRIINSIFEMTIITLFVYMLLSQIEHIEGKNKDEY